MIRCKQATELMSQGMDRRLGFAERVALRLHLLVCNGCRNTARHFRMLRDAMRRHPWRP